MAAKKNAKAAEIATLQAELDNLEKKRHELYDGFYELRGKKYEKRAELILENDTAQEQLRFKIRWLSLPAKTVDLESKFQSTFTEATKLIDEQLAIAYAAIEKAKELSEQFGIPFSTGLSQTSNSYVPTTFNKKWKKIDPDFFEFVSEMEEIDLGYSGGEYGGWTNSYC